MQIPTKSNDRFGIKTIFHIILVAIILVATIQLASLPFNLFSEQIPPFVTLTVSPILNIGLCIIVARLYIAKILKKSLIDFRLGKPKNMVIWVVCAIALPVLVSAFFILLTPGKFGITELSSEQRIQNILTAVLSIGLVAGIAEEMIFRGFMMSLLESRWNKFIAIIAPSLLFAFLHIFNMKDFNALDALQLMLAGTAVGVMFSVIAYQSNSIWPSAIVHGIWNLIIIGGILNISNEPSESIFTYTLHSDSVLLTGGAYGIEASIPAVIGYSIVIVLAMSLWRKQSQL